MAGSYNGSVPGTVGDSSGMTALGLEEPQTGICRSCFPSQKHLPFIPGSALPILLVTDPRHFPKQLCWKASPCDQPECVSLSLTHQF